MLAALGCVIGKGATRAGLDADPAGQWHYLPSTNIDPVACARAPACTPVFSPLDKFLSEIVPILPTGCGHVAKQPISNQIWFGRECQLRYAEDNDGETLSGYGDHHRLNASRSATLRYGLFRETSCDGGWRKPANFCPSWLPA